MKKSGLIRLLLFFLLPMYLVWLYRMDWNPNPLAWSGAELLAWGIATIIWSMAWGCAALAQLRRMRHVRQEMARVSQKRQNEKLNNK